MLVVNVIGAGLAGCEACFQLIKRGIKVKLYEMRPEVGTAVHQTADFCELVCSNSLRSNDPLNAIGLLKNEMSTLDSLIMKYAYLHQIPAGSALAVDRRGFANGITKYIKTHPLVEVINMEVTSIPPGFTIIATGPLTSDRFAKTIQELIDIDCLHFYDAVAPIVTFESVDTNIAYFKARYDKGEASYLNCPLTKLEYQAFFQAIIQATTTTVKQIDKTAFFDGCMPFEEMARRGEKTLLFGPMKPVGLEHNGNRPYAVVQLRQDDAMATLYNLVGFQTQLPWGEQKKIIQMIPGLQNCEIVRYGVMHRNTYIDAPKCLNQYYQLHKNSQIFFAGQITGVEGYLESAASGMVAGINMALMLQNKKMLDLNKHSVIGAMANYISNSLQTRFQPMNANYGIMELTEVTDKSTKKFAYYQQSKIQMEKILCQI